jgi:ATP-dependent DNA helicase RecG
MPDITPYLGIEHQTIEGKSVVVIRVERGANLPYYIAAKGLNHKGVYTRMGSASVSATAEHIRRMIREADGEQYITGRSLLQELTFDRAIAEFAKSNLKLETAQMQTLGIVNMHGQYTNLGLLLSDQCQHTTKVAIFEGTNKIVFKDRREFAGSLFQQLYDVLEFLDLNNRIHAEIGRITRIETRDYPLDAVREAVLNAMVHREYAFSGSTLINLYDDRMEFVTLGGLVSGMTEDAMRHGVSQSRNDKLANVFYKLKLVEAYGTGIIRIFAQYEGQKNQPLVDVTTSSFSLTLPNMTYGVMKNDNEQEQLVLALARQRGGITAQALADALQLSHTRSYNILKALCDGHKMRAEKLRGERTLLYKVIE